MIDNNNPQLKSTNKSFISSLVMSGSAPNHQRIKKSQNGCVRWALCEHLTSPCHDCPFGDQQS